MWQSNFFSCPIIILSQHTGAIGYVTTKPLTFVHYSTGLVGFLKDFLFGNILEKSSCLFIRNFQEIHFSGLFFNQMFMDT